MINSILLAAMLGLGGVQAPSQLRTNLITDTRSVYSYGYPTSATLEQVQQAWRRGNLNQFQVALITTPHVRVGWELPEAIPQQGSYRVLIATKPALLEENKADVWDSGDVKSSETNGISCNTDSLKPATIYYWTVKVSDDKGNVSEYARPQAFLTARQWDNEFERLPLRKTNQQPVSVKQLRAGNWFADFGKDAFAQLSLKVKSAAADTLTIHLGEESLDGEVASKPGASIRYAEYRLPVHRGTDTYRIEIRPDGRNARIKEHGQDVRAVLMPDYIGEVYPFRYCQIEGKKAELLDMQRQMVHYTWDDTASFFNSSDSILNQVWDLCRYSILATSYTGVYVDGDRERIPYEADAIINQLSHYCVDKEYTMARYTTDYLCHNATWPTEWILQAPLLAWADYMYTGDKALLQKDYEILKARTLVELEDANGLISTSNGKQNKDLLRRCGYYGDKISDIVDWPRSGALGVGKEQPGEADGYDMVEYNTVVNAFHYQALVLLNRIAAALGKADDAAYFSNKSEAVKTAINRLLLDKGKGYYRDGIGSKHYALHASMFPMAFGIVPKKYENKVLKHIESRGMACSVYGSQFLLDALYDGGLQDYALQLLVSKGPRGWWNMIERGTTITKEAWGREYKPNLDWNHAWGAAPANIIPRKLMGVEPLEPGWKRMQIKPSPGTLKHAEARVPTILGSVETSFVNDENSFSMKLEIPSGTVAEVLLPCKSKRSTLTVNGTKTQGTYKDGRLHFELQPGTYSLDLKQL